MKKKDQEAIAAADGAAVLTEKPAKKKGFPIVKILVALALLVVFVYFGFTAEVREGSCAVILRFGAVREEITEAGLYFKLPWPFETVVTYDNRLQYLESNHLEVTTYDKRNIIIQSYVVWKIDDPILYHNSVGSQGKVDTYLKDQVFSAINGVMGNYNFKELLSLDKETVKTEEIQQEIFERVRDNCKANYGIAVNDVSILRLQLSDINLQSVFAQMQADRQKEIDIILSEAQKEADKIRSDADTEASKIIADSVNKAAEIKAKTEAEVAKIYADAQAANLDFYQFLKQLDTVVASVGESTVLVVKADEYPFNVLTKYSDYLSTEGDDTIVKDLSYILTQLPEADRQALIDAIKALIESASAGGTAQ